MGEEDDNKEIKKSAPKQGEFVDMGGVKFWPSETNIIIAKLG